ncbi:MAG: hypothetical protein K2K82_09345 [Muribaculaceae bacterium]|nr:hypothetical protein [Muribaculaceae bacterium]
MNTKLFNWLPVAALALGAFACQTDDVNTSTGADPRGEEYTVTTPSEISDSRAAELTASHQQFACNLASEIALPGENTVLSPLSMYNFMAMMANGADGQTLDQILKVLGADSREEVIALCRRQLDSFAAIEAQNQEIPMPSFDDYDREIFTDEQIAELIEASTKELNELKTQTTLANAIWFDSNLEAPYQTYMDECKQWLDANANCIDFKDPSSPMLINQWINEKTNGMIPKIVPSFGQILTEIVCTNALYLNVKWTQGFSIAKEKMTFKNFDGTTSKRIALNVMERFKYLETNEAQFIDIPLGSIKEQLTYTIILPKSESIDATTILPLAAQNVNSLPSKTLIELTIPEHKIETDMDELRYSLENLGMTYAFDKNKADFSRMGGFKFKVFNVAHKASINVCESGIEAAAGTANYWCTSDGKEKEPLKPLVINVDRPFAFRITDNATGMVLFIGVVNRL